MKDITLTVCNKICKECAFNGSTKDTLYAEFYTIMKQGILFPCHLYLKSQTGNESYGTETLKEVKVCRGYVAFAKKYNLISAIASNYPSQVKYWIPLLKDIKIEELRDILSLEELIENHKGLNRGVYLGNSITA
jgi:hypothetical protein